MNTQMLSLLVQSIWCVIKQKTSQLGLESHSHWGPFSLPEQCKAASVSKKLNPDECTTKHSDSIAVAIRRNPEQDVGKLYKLSLRRQRPHLGKILNVSLLYTYRTEN